MTKTELRLVRLLEAVARTYETESWRRYETRTFTSGPYGFMAQLRDIVNEISEELEKLKRPRRLRRGTRAVKKV